MEGVLNATGSWTSPCICEVQAKYSSSIEKRSVTATSKSPYVHHIPNLTLVLWITFWPLRARPPNFNSFFLFWSGCFQQKFEPQRSKGRSVEDIWAQRVGSKPHFCPQPHETKECWKTFARCKKINFSGWPFSHVSNDVCWLVHMCTHLPSICFFGMKVWTKMTAAELCNMCVTNFLRASRVENMDPFFWYKRKSRGKFF